jgi:hypothetical protein
MGGRAGRHRQRERESKEFEPQRLRALGRLVEPRDESFGLFRAGLAVPGNGFAPHRVAHRCRQPAPFAESKTGSLASYLKLGNLFHGATGMAKLLRH